MSIAEQTWMGKPASEMTPEEWEACKAYVDAHVAAQGKEPLDWSTVSQPKPLTERDIAWAKEVFKRYGLDKS
jgi:hypothetical protein